MVVYMLKHAKKLRGEIGGRIETASRSAGTGAWVGVFLLVLLMITREGMEMAFITAHARAPGESGSHAVGRAHRHRSRRAARLGLVAFWARVISAYSSSDLHLPRPVCAQLLVYAFHEATEANVLPIDNSYWHIATEPYGLKGSTARC